jgi:hypothetical protein
MNPSAIATSIFVIIGPPEIRVIGGSLRSSHGQDCDPLHTWRKILVVPPTRASSGRPVQLITLLEAQHARCLKILDLDPASVGNSCGALALNGFAYGFSAPGGYQILQADPLNYLCISGRCLGTYVAPLTIGSLLGCPAKPDSFAQCPSIASALVPASAFLTKSSNINFLI